MVRHTGARRDATGRAVSRFRRPTRTHVGDDTIVTTETTPGLTPRGSAPRSARVLDVAMATDIGRVRHNNEDYACTERVVSGAGSFAVWAVADGVGGGPQGEFASRIAVDTVVDYLAGEPWTDPREALTAAFTLANRRVFALSGDGAAATTLVVAVISEATGAAHIANVGDSRAYLIAGGDARPITEDHSVVAVRVAAGQLTAAEARQAADRSVLTRGVGAEADVLVDVFGPRTLRPGERLVLCTDGVHGMVDDGVIARLASEVPIAEAPGALVAAANEAGGRDNATIIVGGMRAPVVGVSAGIVTRPPRRAVLVGALALLIPLAAVVGIVVFSGGSRPRIVPGAVVASPSPYVGPASASAAPSSNAATSKPLPAPSAKLVPSARLATQSPKHPKTSRTPKPTAAPTLAATPAATPRSTPTLLPTHTTATTPVTTPTSTGGH